jgi:hypothetical protein
VGVIPEDSYRLDGEAPQIGALRRVEGYQGIVVEVLKLEVRDSFEGDRVGWNLLPAATLPHVKPKLADVE